MVEGLGYYAFVSYSKNELNDLILLLCFTMGVYPSHHSPNDVTLLLTTSNVHDQETMIIN